MTTFAAKRDIRIGRSLLIGVLGGLGLGTAARLWMRAIAVDPEFTWSGTLGILIGFTMFGFAQSIAAIARRGTHPSLVSLARVFGVVAMLPLFIAAGAPMLPTVICGGLASARPDWRPALRVTLVVLASLPVVFVAHDITQKFGLSLQTAVGIIGLIAVYAAIIWATRFTLARRTDNWRLPRWVTLTSLAAACFTLAVPLALGGIK